MKKDKLQDAIGMVGDDLIEEAANSKKRKKLHLIPIVAAMLCVCLVVGVALRPHTQEYMMLSENKEIEIEVQKENILHSASAEYCISKAKYPETAPCPIDNGLYDQAYNDAVNDWGEERFNQRQNYRAIYTIFKDYYTESIRTFMSGYEGENVIYSPVNVYMALAMLAEVTDGNSRAQILDAMGVDSIEAVRKNASVLWSSSYRDDGVSKTLLGNSIWLNDHVTYNESTMQTIADNYYASSYSGEMGSGAYNSVLHDWLNEQTGGLLKDKVDKIELKPETVMAIASTIYYKARWSDEFHEGLTEKDIFHGTDKDTEVDFMHRTDSRTYYWGDKFSAVNLDADAAGSMFLILPDEGVTPEELINDSETLSFIADPDARANNQYVMVNMSIPKFDVSSQIDLCEGLKRMGVTDVFDEAISDFSPMSDELNEIVLSKADHAARVKIDEEGCEAAAYTVVICEATSARPPDDEVDFVLDRPFIFAVMSDSGAPLFVGIVNNI